MRNDRNLSERDTHGITMASNMLKQMSDPTRIQILLHLDENGEQNVGDMTEYIAQTQPSMSHHLSLLRHGGLVSARRQGKNIFYELTSLGEGVANAVRCMIV